MRIIRYMLIALVTVALCAAMAAQEQKGEARTAEAKSAQKAVSWYKVELALHELEGGKRINTRNYTLMIADNAKRVELRIGSRMVQGSPVDVGLNAVCVARELDGQLSLWASVDWSNFTPSEQAGNAQLPPVVRQSRTEGEVAITLGKPTLVSSVDDVVSKRRYQVEVTVVKQ